MGNSIDTLVGTILISRSKLPKWKKAYAQGYQVGYNRLSVKERTSKAYRSPKFVSVIWHNGFEIGKIDREEEENRRIKK